MGFLVGFIVFFYWVLLFFLVGFIVVFLRAFKKTGGFVWVRFFTTTLALMP